MFKIPMTKNKILSGDLKKQAGHQMGF